MAQHGVLVLGLDGFDIEFARPMFEAGELPALRALRDRSATFLLDHGDAARTGLAWEQFVTGLSNESTHRTSVVELMDAEYDVRQTGARFTPSFAAMDARVIVFDSPYTDLLLAPNASGVVGWGAHDAGIALTSSPPGLREELDAAVEPYPAHEWMYASPWASTTRTAEMCAGLLRGLETRRAAAQWLLTERFEEWDLALVVTGEAHTAAEGLWHGADPDHAVHSHPSAPIAAQGLLDVYRSIDQMVGELIAATNPRSVIAFSMGGMGTNNSDVPSMVLLPELVYRWSTGKQLLEVPDEWSANPGRAPILDEDETWSAVLATCYPPTRPWWHRAAGAITPSWARARMRRSKAAPESVSTTEPAKPAGDRIGWMPATWYRDSWSTMRAFALPSYYDGRIRINLEGREPAGIVTAAEYDGVVDELEAVLRAARNPATGAPVVRNFTRSPGDPAGFGPADADIVVEWSGPTLAIEHPTLGLVGPVPVRRTGGHTGPHGFAFVAGAGVVPGDRGVRSAFDVNPTMAELLGLEPSPDHDGTTLVDAPH